MKIIFLGTNGWYSTPTGDTPCILIDSNDRYIILDAGNGIYKLDQFVKEDKPISMFISHFHLDHTAGLHILNKFEFKQGIDVYLGRGRAKDFEALVNIPFTVGYKPKPENVYNLRSKIRLHELPEEGENIPFKAIAIPQHHAYGNHGFRFEIDGKVIAYTGDCGLSDGLKKLAQNADLLIAECNNKKTSEDDLWGHLDPYQVATIAKEEGVKQLILTHFGPIIYPTKEDRVWAREEARKIFPNTEVAFDLSEFELNN